MEAESREIPTGTTGLYKDTVTLFTFGRNAGVGCAAEWGAEAPGAGEADGAGSLSRFPCVTLGRLPMSQARVTTSSCCGQVSRPSEELPNSGSAKLLGVLGQAISFSWACYCTCRVGRGD